MSKIYSSIQGIHTSLSDAFFETEKGQYVLEVKKQKEKEKIKKQQETAFRVRSLKNEAFKVLVKDSKNFDLYAKAKVRIRLLGARGGDEYSRVLNMLKIAYSSKAAWNGAVGLLLKGK